MQVVDEALRFIQQSKHPQSFTLAPINETADNTNIFTFGSPAALTSRGATYLLEFIQAVLDKITATNREIPPMFQSSKQQEYWSECFPADTNIVFGLHYYWFIGSQVTSQNLSSLIWRDAKLSRGDGKFPVFVGEWSIQAALTNSLLHRKQNLNTGLDAFAKYTTGSSYWTAKYQGNGTAKGEGTQADYWSFENFIDLGYLDPLEDASC